MKASGEKFQKFLDEMREEFPVGFEDSIGDAGLSMGVTAFCFVAFMAGGSAESCVRDLIAKVGIEDE